MSQPFADAIREYLRTEAEAERLIDSGMRPDHPDAIRLGAQHEHARRQIDGLLEAFKALPQLGADPTNTAGLRPHQDDTVAAMGIVSTVSGALTQESRWIVKMIEEALDKARRAGWESSRSTARVRLAAERVRRDVLRDIADRRDGFDLSSFDAEVRKEIEDAHEKIIARAVGDEMQHP